ncbi:GNAT family N-acetyltransferase [Oricola cellulosilytica]|nr:GNAT family N-acetyltransferase [Oricola cellulosilytica]
MTLRTACDSDVDVLLSLQREAFGEDPHCLTREGFEAFLIGGRTDVIAAERGGVVVGYAVLNNRPFRPWTALDYIAVKTSLRGGGIGEALLAEAMTLARRRTVRLFVRPTNRAAIRFYKRHGFDRSGIRANNYADGEDAVIMTRRRP